MKTKLKKTAKYWVPILGGVAVGVGGALCYRNRCFRFKWHKYYVTPDQLQFLIDNPERTIVFESGKGIVANSKSVAA